ncbi:MAG: response regulator [Alphaproteobacteria bacterium]|nr:response regulator [Alphaproteobacteria bacterium]MBU1514736.1 response regulator [Alphaproteobacteria bacterium]MBU2093867.1 response regulator [Alphaproteobacteria bacterium]MBU2309722.1 response regulator [Alphaproteobacteria bacterium]
MRVQTALLPYALLAFGVCLPIFVWVASHAANVAWMSASFAAFAVGWGVFYAAVNWLKTPAATDLRRRGLAHILSGLVWALAIAQLALFAQFAGPVRETLLLLTLGAAMICVVFTTPWLPSLLIVAPVAIAGPLIALFLGGGSPAMAQLALAAAALALALALLVNRILRGQFALAAEREVLIAERVEQAESARRLARSKSDLVSTLSDEIRNGLTGVAHVLASAAGRGRAAPTRQQIGAALDAVNDLLAVLETTVDAESAEAGRLTVEPKPVDLTAVARDLVLLNRPAAAAKGLELAVHVDAALADGQGCAIADPARARQVLAALIGNAVKFTMRGRVEVRLSLIGEDRIAVAVADTGPGLADHELAAALRPFERVARTSAGSSGAGLGLPLAVQLAKLMGGDLRAESAPGVGSCFTFELPFDPAARLAVAEPLPQAVERPGRRLRILTVETDPLSAAMLRASLEQLGHQVVHAADGGRAVDLARICDLDLVVADGAATIAALRALTGAAAHTPVVALTAGDDAESQAALAAGADALLRRPVAVPAAARAITEALSASAAGRAAANDRSAA